MDSKKMRKVVLSMFEDNDLQRVHDFSMKLLWENGITFPGKRALDIFKKHGFRVEGEQVYITESQVRKALETAPSHFVIRGRNSERNLDLGAGDYGVPGPIGPVNVLDLDQGRRLGTLKDMENLVKIYQASNVMTMNSNNGVEANDIDISVRHLMIMRALLRHTDKPFYTKLFTYEQMHEAMDMIEIVMGEKLVPGGNIYLSSGSTPSLSPMAWSSEVTDCIIALSERGQVVTTGTATSTGVTGPVRIFGTLVMQNAELLSGIVLSQLVNPGNPVGYGTGATPGNMRGAKYCCGSPDRVALQVGSIELGKRFYKLPSRTITYGSDSVNMDVQGGIESYENVMGNTLSGADYMLSEIGTLEGLMTTSYEKTIIDEEITSRLLHMRNGIDISDEAASLDVIMKVGSRGEFITSKDTMAHFREGWYPKYTDWNSTPASRSIEDYEYVLRRANAEWKRRLAEAPDTMLDKAVEQELEAYIKNHSK
ncbi:trimethylamine methyltransferase family protein [Sporomusa sphaeroides]|uniref:Trimethylamine methyltransferase (MTTB) n=1 Tax=Sporomusa sphaeroides DSM 2875 TaxID=1337886 RepID=A0ABP2C968_9FIRM|nr:trimethylamine methyltransferase family protein [Sporomusa sphaeroides]OLS54629.1 trimethylamine methyltransferase MttB [Sporomusa sphaeroides DSM 2875]CVK20840.1 Trimethylamine methyltransferase (MTTB) [Sporomusa sphaeroides DSM 2875]